MLAGGCDSGPRAMRAVDVRALIVETMLHKNVDDAKTAGRGWNSIPSPPCCSAHDPLDPVASLRDRNGGTDGIRTRDLLRDRQAC